MVVCLQIMSETLSSILGDTKYANTGNNDIANKLCKIIFVDFGGESWI